MAENIITLVVGGPREEVSLEDAQNAILPRFRDEVAAHRDTKIVLDMSGKVWRRNVLELFRPFLTREVKPRLVVLNIDDIIAQLNTDDGLSSLQFFGEVLSDPPFLRSISVRSNALGHDGIQQLKPIFNGRDLKELRLDECGLSEAAALTLNKTIGKSVLEQLTVLSLAQNRFESGGAKTIGQLLRKCVSLEVFRYRDNSPSDDDGNVTPLLCKALAHISSSSSIGAGDLPQRSARGHRYNTRSVARRERTGLRVIDIDSLNVDSTSIGFLYTTMSKSPMIQILSLADCNLGPTGLSLVLFGLRDSGAANLTSIDLQGNGLNTESARALAEFFEEPQALQSIEEIDFSYNEIGDDGVVRLASALSNAQRLQSLKLIQTEVTDIGAQAMLNHPVENLETLDLTDNEISTNLANKLTEAYPCVLVDEEYDNGEESDDEIDGLADSMAETQFF